MISKHSVVETQSIGSNVTVGEFCVIRPDAVIGDNVFIHPHVVIEAGATIGDDVEIFPGAYIGKRPKGAGSTSRPISYEERLLIGRGCSVGPHAVIYYDVEIGESTLVGDGASIREGSRIGFRCVIGRYVTVNYATIIGNEVKIMDHSWLAGNMSVGNHVFISGGVTTANDNDMGLYGYDAGRVVGPRIQDGARIGVGAVILPRVAVGEQAVVAAGAVVTRDVAPWNVVAGVPAKVLKDVRESSPES